MNSADEAQFIISITRIAVALEEVTFHLQELAASQERALEITQKFMEQVSEVPHE